MNYLPLHLKYRPQVFEDLIGQEVSAQIIKKSIEQGRIPNSYLLYGNRGCGKTSAGRIISKTLNCNNVTNGNPCNKCQTCIDISNDTYLDVLEIDAGSHSGVDDARELMQLSQYGAKYGKYKVIGIDECHNLTSKAWDALLKIIEEPSLNVKFIFCTTEINKVPDTIKSRSQMFYFKPIESKDIFKRLNYINKEEKLNMDNNVLSIISKKTDSLRDAVILLDQCIVVKDDKDLLKRVLNMIEITDFEHFVDCLVEKDFKKLDIFINTLSVPIEVFLEEAIEYLCKQIIDETEVFKRLDYEKWIKVLGIMSSWKHDYAKSYSKICLNEFSVIKLIDIVKDIKENKDTSSILEHVKIFTEYIDGYYKKVNDMKYIITSKKGNQLQVVYSIENVDAGFYCLYPIDTTKFIYNKKPIPDLIKDGIIKRK